MNDFSVKLKFYRNDFDKYFVIESFCDLESLKKYLIEQSELRDYPKSSPHYHAPCGYREYDGKKTGWFRTGRIQSQYSLRLTKVSYEDTVVFEEGSFCSESFYEFLKELKKEFEKKER